MKLLKPWNTTAEKLKNINSIDADKQTAKEGKTY